MRHTNRHSIDQLTRDRLDDHDRIGRGCVDSSNPVVLHTEEATPS